MSNLEELNKYQSHDLFVSATEILMKEPSMLIHYPVFRRVFMVKMEDLLNFIRTDVRKKTKNDNTPLFQEKYDRIEILLLQMKDVLKGIKTDPNYAEF